MIKLFIDLDGVLININKFIQEVINNSGVDISIKESFIELCKPFSRNNFLEKCEKINNSFELIKFVKQQYKLIIITHCYSDSEAELKINFIKKKIQDVKCIATSFDKTKNEMLPSAEKSILIDDYVVNVDNWIENGDIEVHFRDKQNGQKYPIIDDLRYLLYTNFLKELDN